VDDSKTELAQPYLQDMHLWWVSHWTWNWWRCLSAGCK